MSDAIPMLRLLAPAKINLMLIIEGRRPDGYHNLQTIFQALQWGDELTVRPLARKDCVIRCKQPGVPTDASNLIHRAWRLLIDRFPGKVPGIEVDLLKRIPAGGGLGGGSSDAAATLVAVNRLGRLRLGAARLEALAAELGSDCAFFIRGGTALATGRGEVLQPLVNRCTDTWAVVVCPGFPSATAAAYGKLRPQDFGSATIIKAATRALRSGNRGWFEKNAINSFSRVVSDGDLKYKFIIDRMLKAGLRRPMLSGSGSSVFSLVSHSTNAHRACAVLQQVFPESFAARFSRAGVRFLTS